MKARRQGVRAIHPSEGARAWGGDRDAGTSRRAQRNGRFDNSRLGRRAGRARLRRRLTWPIPSSRREPHAARPRTLCRPVNILLRSGAPASNGPVRPRSLARSIVSLEGSSTLPSWAEVTPLPLPILFRRTPRSPHAGSESFGRGASQAQRASHTAGTPPWSGRTAARPRRSPCRRERRDPRARETASRAANRSRITLPWPAPM